MKQYFKQVALGLLLVALVLGAAVLVHRLANLSEEHYISRMHAPQLGNERYSSAEELKAALASAEDAFLDTQVQWTSERGEVPVRVASMGTDIQEEETFSYLDRFMNEASDLEKFRVLVFGKTLTLPLNTDEEAIKAAFAESGVEQGMAMAHYALDEDGTVTVVPEQIGYGIHAAAVESLLESTWKDYRGDASVSLELPLQTSLPEIRQELFETALARAQILSAAPVEFRDDFGDSWEWTMAEHIDWLIPNEVHEALVLDTELFTSFVEAEMAPEIEEEAQTARIIAEEDGSYSFEGSARHGREIDMLSMQDELTEALKEWTAGSEGILLSLDVIEIEPEVEIPEELQAKGVTELLGYGYSNFQGSPYNRIHNVNIGMDSFSGLLIEQGDTFSFTSLMGPIDASQGYLPELVIKGDETIPEYGGGLCQVSSTIYRAALTMGLPITERRNHSYAVSYYAYPDGYGLDATIYDSWPDLKFLNDTPGAILVQGYTDGYNAYFVFYGTDDGRSVEMEGPYSYNYHSISEPKITYTDQLAPGERQLDSYAHTGFDVDWYRTVNYPEGHYLYPEGHTVEETIHSSYEARPTKYLEGKTEEMLAEESGS